MPRHRHKLPQLESSLYLTDGGIETTLIFLEGWQLPYFAAFHLFNEPGGEQALRSYFETHARIACKFGAGFIYESATWRASPDWAGLLGYSMDELSSVNRRAIEMLVDLRDKIDPTDAHKSVISGCVGPRGDGYAPDRIMTVDAARAYHAHQINGFASTDADMITAITMTNVPEAIAIADSSAAAGMPCAIGFTVETDGRLPTGSTLADAIASVDAESKIAPAYYMINCAHTTHFADTLDQATASRIRGLRANASRCSHAELDEAEELDDGNPEEFGREYALIRQRFPHINVLGGCCGTDHRHMSAVAEAVINNKE